VLLIPLFLSFFSANHKSIQSSAGKRHFFCVACSQNMKSGIPARTGYGQSADGSKEMKSFFVTLQVDEEPER
jgi:hypothetical protein